MRIRNRRFVATFAGLVVLGALAHSAISEDKTARPADGGEPAAQPAAASSGGAAGLPDAKMMEEMMKANAPGEQHALLKRMAGTFDGEVIMKMSAEAPEMKSKGREVNTMILNGRFLKTDYTGDMMGMAFNGMQLNGYDNFKKKYVSVWVDSMNTGAMTAEGTADASGKTITYGGEYPCPAEGGKIKQFRQVLTFIDDDHHEFAMYEKDASGKEVRGLYIKYTRVK